MREAAPAKLNLYLHVVGRRPDGFHLLDSAAVFLDVGDEVRVEEDEALSLCVEGPFAAALDEAGAQENLVMKAAQALRRKYGVLEGAKLTLVKNLPVGAGLGGGSADAAAALRLLARQWKLERADLAALARTLGSDTAACLVSQSLRMRGVGDEITLLAASWPEHFVLANPMIPLATPQVYDKFRDAGAAFSGPAETDWAQLPARECLEALRAQGNDLEPAAQALCPQIAQVLEALAALAGSRMARMSGSGATCFAVFDTAEQARFAARELTQKQPRWWVKAARRL